MHEKLQRLLLIACTESLFAFAHSGYRISGKVLQPDGKALRHLRPVVMLSCGEAPSSQETVADENGRFEFAGLHAGIYTLVAAVPGAPLVRKTLDIAPSAADTERCIAVDLRLHESSAAARTASVGEISVPESARHEHAKSRIRLKKSDVKGAVDCLKKALALAPQFAAAWNDLGAIAFRSRDYSRAEACFREALRMEPRSYPPLVNLGNVLLTEKKTEESVIVNRQAVEQNPGDPMAEAQLGVSYLWLNNEELAFLHLKKAKALDPAHFSYPQLYLGQIYSRRRDYAAAAAEMEEFLRLHPGSRLAPEIRKHLEKIRGLQSF